MPSEFERQRRRQKGRCAHLGRRRGVSSQKNRSGRGPQVDINLAQQSDPDEELIAEVALNLNKAPAVPVALGLVDRIKNAEQLSSELQPGNQAP